MYARLCCTIAILSGVLCLVSPAMAEEQFKLLSYTFVGEFPKAGSISMRIEKNQNGLNILVGSRGGAMSTVHVEPAKAKAAAEVLLQAEAYYKKHQDFFAQKKSTNSPLYRQEHTDIVKVEGYQVFFQTEPRGEQFRVKFGKARPFNPMALMTKEEALLVGERLLKGEEMARFVERHVTF